MATKNAKSTKKKKASKSPTKVKTKKSKTKSSKKAKSAQSLGDTAIVIVDDDLEIDKEKEIEERRAYLEEARSQEAFD